MVSPVGGSSSASIAAAQAAEQARVREDDPVQPGAQAVPTHDEATQAAVAGANAADAAQRVNGVAPANARFPSADAAAHDALTRANPQSIRDNLEYGGLVFKDRATGLYSASPPLRGTDTGFDPSRVTVPSGVDVVGDYHTHGDYSTADTQGRAVRSSNPANDAFNSDNFSRTDYRGITTDAQGKPGYAGYLGTPSGEFKRFDPATKVENTLRAPVMRNAAGGALVGAAAEAGLSTVKALSDGRITADEGRDILSNSARGAVVGGTYAVTEQGLVRVADRVAGSAVQRAATSVATTAGAAEAGAIGAATRTVATRLGGAGAAGAVISAGISVYENREGLMQGDSDAIGRVAGDTVVGATAALSGAAAGAAIGSVVPGVGTVVGAVVGLGVGFAADYVMRAGGVDKAIGNAVSSGVDAVKDAGRTVAGWFGW